MAAMLQDGANFVLGSSSEGVSFCFYTLKSQIKTTGKIYFNILKIYKNKCEFKYILVKSNKK